jgi:hypothetical protein
VFKTNEEAPVFLAFFDVLGTSKLIQSGQTHKVLELYEYLTGLVKKYQGRMCLGREFIGANEAIGVVFTQTIFEAHFSDTFIIWSNAEGEPRFPPFIDSCMDVFCEAICKGIPLRGGISIGNAIMNTETQQYVGDPLRETAKVESSQRWLGFSFGKSFYNHPCYDSYYYIPYDRHIKQNCKKDISLYAINWVRYFRNKKPDEDIIQLVSRMNDQKEFSEYYTNTIEFIRFADAHPKWWENMGMNHVESQNPYETIAEMWLEKQREDTKEPSLCAPT